jgi:hypothetical protein
MEETMSGWLLRKACVIGAMVLLPATVSAQGAIGGVVRDTSGSVLPGVTVEATSPALIERTRSAVTDGNGQYLIVDLRPGVYTVTFSLQGFTNIRRDGLELSSGVTLPINAELTVGAIEETVIVTGATPVVDVQNTRQQTVLRKDVLDVIPRSRSVAFTALLLPGMSGAIDMGGVTGESPGTRLAIHGGSPEDQIQAIDGMKVTNGSATGARRNIASSDAMAAEYTYEVNAISAETATGGVKMNIVPKEGGNNFSGVGYGEFTNGGLNADNLTRELRALGLTSASRVKKYWDASGALGGPLKRDRLWFYTVYRKWTSENLPPDAFYLSDPTRPGVDIGRWWLANARLTWQATPRNRVSFFSDHQGRDIPFLGVSRLKPPETATGETNPNLHLTQAKWTSPVTSKLLFEASAQHYYEEQFLNMSPDSRLKVWDPAPADPSAWPAFEITAGKWVGGTNVDGIFFPRNTFANWLVMSSALSYVTGSHAFKFGVTHNAGRRFAFYPAAPPVLRFNNGVPFQVQLWSMPTESKPRVNHELGLYAMDQWTRVSARAERSELERHQSPNGAGVRSVWRWQDRVEDECEPLHCRRVDALSAVRPSGRRRERSGHANHQ